MNIMKKVTQLKPGDTSVLLKNNIEKISRIVVCPSPKYLSNTWSPYIPPKVAYTYVGVEFL